MRGNDASTDPMLAALDQLHEHASRGERAVLVRDAEGGYRVVLGSKEPAGTVLLASICVPRQRDAAWPEA